MKPGIREFHVFIKGTLAKRVRDAYEKLAILSEADLQAQAWCLVRDFLRGYDPEERKFRVLNKPYFKDLRIHPDLAVFRKKITTRSARREWRRLIKARKLLKPKRVYLVYVARWGNGRVLTGPKGPGA